MARTTLNLDAPILAALKRLQKAERKPLGELVSELVAEALTAREQRDEKASSFHWIREPMGTPAVDLEDRDTLYRLLDA